jgi:anti-sigma B factor antagonist
MDQMEPKISVDSVGSVVVVTLLLEKILEQSDILALQNSIMPLIEKEPAIKLVIDFSKVEFLSSSVLGLLIRISKNIYEAGGKLRLCCISPKIEEIFKITRLDKVFQISTDKDTALLSLE